MVLIKQHNNDHQIVYLTRNSLNIIFPYNANKYPSELLSWKQGENRNLLWLCRGREINKNRNNACLSQKNN